MTTLTNFFFVLLYSSYFLRAVSSLLARLSIKSFMVVRANYNFGLSRVGFLFLSILSPFFPTFFALNPLALSPG